MTGAGNDGPGHDLDVQAIRKDFPILATQMNGKPLTYLDTAATSQKPQSVLDAMDRYYETSNANVHRAAYSLAEAATNALEGARAKVARFIGAGSANEVVFTKNATESLNLVAHAWGSEFLSRGDVVVLSQLEHHANIVPWHQLSATKGIEIRWIPVGDDGRLDLTDLDALLDGAKMLAVTAMSNVTGTITPVTEMAERAHAAGALVSVDACQYAPHLALDVQTFGADFVSFSSHKMLGPTGIGVLWGRPEVLDATPPFLGGGGMILDVTMDGFTPAAVPQKFEAGTPAVAEAVGLGAAVDYLDALGMDQVRAHEVALNRYAIEMLTDRFGDTLTIHGPQEPEARGGVLSFALADIHPHDMSQVLNEHGVGVRPGHHCAKPLMRVLGVGATTRASWYVYNDTDDIDVLGDALADAKDFFGL